MSYKLSRPLAGLTPGTGMPTIVAMLMLSPIAHAQTHTRGDPTQGTQVDDGTPVTQPASSDRPVTAAPRPAMQPTLMGATSADAEPGGTGLVSRIERSNPLGNALRSLNARGVSLSANYVYNVAGNPVGGVRQGTAQSHWFDVGAELDLDRLLGLSNTRIHAQGADFEGESLGVVAVGNSVSFQQTWRPVSGWRLTQLNIDHDFGKLNVMVGRAAVNSYYSASPFNCNFMSNTSCLTAYGPITSIGITAFPNSSWAGKLRYNISKKVYVQSGVFDYNNNLNLHGAAGVDFSFFKGSGKLISSEVGYETSFANDRLPRRYRFGVHVNTDPGTSLLYDRNGNLAGQTGLTRVQQTGTRVGIYAMADQTLTRPDPHTQRNFAVFARAFYNAGAPEQVKWFASAGFVKTGTFKGRDDDTLNFIVSNTRWNDQEIEYLREVRARAGGIGAPHANEIVGEINYGFAAAPGVRIMPNLQYAINPDPINAPTFPRNIPSTLVLGLRLDVRLAQLLTGG